MFECVRNNNGISTGYICKRLLIAMQLMTRYWFFIYQRCWILIICGSFFGF